MKLIAEHHQTGGFYVYRETEAMFRKNEPQRLVEGLTQKTLEECDHECLLNRGQYVVVDIAPVRGNQRSKR